MTKLTKDQSEQLKCALSELSEAKFAALSVQRRLAPKPGSLNDDDLSIVIGTIDLAFGWIERVLRGEKLAKIPKK